MIFVAKKSHLTIVTATVREMQAQWANKLQETSCEPLRYQDNL
jgi:hypothetical protein